MFEKRNESVITEIKTLERRLAKIEGKLEERKDVLGLTDEYASVKKKLTDMQIEHDRAKENWDREKREVEHMVGLERKRGEFERESGVREAKLAVREENLSNAVKRLEDQATFQNKRFEAEVGYLKELMTEVLERLPTTKALITVGSKAATNGSAREEE